MSIDKGLTLLLIKNKYGSINNFLSDQNMTRALFYTALSLDRAPIHKASKTRDLLTRLESEGLLVRMDSSLSLQLKHIS